MKKINNKVQNNQKGITLLALVITIVVLIILTSITINIGKNEITESKEDTMLSELKIVQNAILQKKTKADLIEEAYPGQTIIEANIDLDEVILFFIN